MQTQQSHTNDKNCESGHIHIHIFNRHIPTVISYIFLFIFLLTTVFVLSTVITIPGISSTTKADIVLKGPDGSKSTLTFGSWPALQNEDFFQQTKQQFIDSKESFVEANLSAMTIRYYEKGELKKESPITTKGREGSWWETPAGLYQISTKEENHFSSFGQVNMPYSMQFQGNFFIHGPTSYPDGTPTSSTYSGGCIRVGLEDVEEIYNLVEVGTPLLVFEEVGVSNEDEVKTTFKHSLPIPDGVAYLAADLENNFVFAESLSTEERSIASITKLLTALIAVEYINVEKEVYISPSHIASTSIPRLNVGENVAVLDLLSLLLQESSNEAALAIPQPLGSSYFLSLMNKKADAIGMINSTFVDTSGVLSGNVSTAEDLFQLSKYLYYNRSFILHMTMGEEKRTAYGPARYPYLQNFNTIPGTTGEIGGKTGHSTTAKDSMLSVFDITIDGETHPITIIVLGSDDAKRDTQTIFRYVKNNFSVEEL